MKMWFLAVGLAVLAASGLLARIRRRNRQSDFTTEPLSGEWLANARVHEDHNW
jgi:LPXTG-motif cell wall-anchored protein